MNELPCAWAVDVEPKRSWVENTGTGVNADITGAGVGIVQL